MAVPVLAIEVTPDERLGRHDVAVLDRNDRVIWRGLRDSPDFAELLLGGFHKIRMHPSEVRRHAAYAASQGQPPIVED